MAGAQAVAAGMGSPLVGWHSVSSTPVWPVRPSAVRSVFELCVFLWFSVVRARRARPCLCAPDLGQVHRAIPVAVGRDAFMRLLLRGSSISQQLCNKRT